MLTILLPQGVVLKTIHGDVESVFVHQIGNIHTVLEYGHNQILYRCVLLFICDGSGRLLLEAKKDCLIACFDSFLI
jgi:hypothetical protein